MNTTDPADAAQTPVSTSVAQHLAGHSYLSLATFRRDGRKVATPVWFAEVGGDAVVFSAASAGKVKRLRNSSRAEVAVCDVRGRLLGPWRGAAAFIMDNPGQIVAAHAALRKRYGWQMWLADVGARLTGRIRNRAFLRITIEDQGPSSGNK